MPSYILVWKDGKNYGAEEFASDVEALSAVPAPGEEPLSLERAEALTEEVSMEAFNEAVEKLLLHGGVLIDSAREGDVEWALWEV